MKKLSQAARVLAYLKRHGKISTVQGMTELCIMRLSNCIVHLRKQGHDIRTTQKNGNGIATYSLEAHNE